MSETTQETESPTFGGQPVRDVPVPKVGLLRDDEFGAAVLSEYHDRVRADYDNNPALRIFKISGRVVHGSNPFACCLIDMIVRPELRVATPVDVQMVLDAQGKNPDALNLRGYYKDVALALRSIREPNGYLAERLNEQVGLKTPLPVVICLSGLEVVNDPDSPCGLSFALTDDSFFFTAPILLEQSGHFDNTQVDRNTGLPKALGGSERYYYGTEEGLCRVYIGRGSSLDTIWDELANSQLDGRVVLVSNRVPVYQVSKYLERLDRAIEVLGEDY